jgi:DNA-binding response OmpR family regulator
MNKINKKILLIEDDAPLRNVLRDKFTIEGFDVIDAKDGEEGLAKALSEHPDLIMLDIILPKMDGITMLKKLREDAWGRDVHVFMLTNLSDNEKVADALQNNAFEYFVKSDIKIEDLVTKVRGTLGV